MPLAWAKAGIQWFQYVLDAGSGPAWRIGIFYEALKFNLPAYLGRDCGGNSMAEIEGLSAGIVAIWESV